MLHYRESESIDRQAWDACIDGARSVPYGLSWYLDGVCEHWGGLVLDDYRAVFPLPWKKRLGMRWVYPPFFCQQLGLFAPKETLVKGRKATSAPPELAECLKAIPSDFVKVDLAVQFNSEALNGPWRGAEKTNYLLALDDEPEVLRSRYDSNTSRNLKKALKAGLQCDEQMDPEALSALIRREQGPKIDVLREADYARIAPLMQAAQSRNRGRMIRVYDPASPEQTLAAAFFVLGPRGPLYLFGTSTIPGRQKGAMVWLFDRIVVENAPSKGLFLDFEGSSIPGLARFYQGFGSVREPYQTLHMRRFPLNFKVF